MKKIISLVLILSLLMSTTSLALPITAYAENDNSNVLHNIAEHDGIGIKVENIYDTEKNTESISHEEAKLIQKKLENQENAGNPEGVSLFSDDDKQADNGYSEIVYIYSAADLCAVDGHQGGYYELKNDISFWNEESIELYDATINGNGHTVNMRVNRSMPEGRQFVGLISGADNYVADLTLKFDIDVTMHGGIVKPLGYAYAHNCTLIGDMDVSVKSRYENMDDYDVVKNLYTDFIYGIDSGSGNRYVGDISVSGDVESTNDVKPGCFEVYALNNCVDSSFKGNISVKKCPDYIHNNRQWVSQATLYGITESRNCHIDGDIDINANAYLIYYSSESGITGNINAEFLHEGLTVNYLPYFSFCSAYGIVASDNCYIDGNIDATGDYTYLHNQDTIMHKMDGINNCESCYIKGDITTRKVYSSGINGGNSCTVRGDISAYDLCNTITYTAISGSNCSLYGQVYVQFASGPVVGGQHWVRGSDGYNNKITGYIHVSDLSLRKSFAIPNNTNTYWYCCGRLTRGKYISANNENNIYGYRYLGCSKCYGQLHLLPSFQFERIPANDSGAPEPVPEKPISFSIQVINALNGQPLQNAEVSADGTTAITDVNGIAFFNQSKHIGGLYIKNNGRILYSETDYIANHGVNTIWVTDVNIDENSFNFGNNASENIIGAEINIKGKKMPVINLPMEFDFNLLDAVSVAYNPSDNTLEVIMDLEKIHSKDALQKEWMKKYTEFSDLFDDAINGRLEPEEMHKYNKSKSSEGNTGKLGKKFGIDGDVSVKGFLTVKLDENMSVLEGGIILSGSLEKKGTLPVPSAPWFYFAYGVGGSLAGGLELELVNSTYNEPEFDICGNIKFGLEPQIGTGFGFKDFLAIEAGIEGELTAETTLPFESFSESFTSKLTASVYTLVNTLGADHKGKWEFVNTQIYPKEDTLSLMSIDSPEDLKIVQRDYNSGIELMSAEEGVIKSGLYPYTAVKLAEFDYGRKLMVWLDDDTERDLYNKTALFYSYYNGGEWSEPKQVYNDGTADFEFELKTVGSKALLVWQNITSELTGEDDVTTTAEKSELCYAEFNNDIYGDSTWSEPVNITEDNTVYEYEPGILSDGSSISVVWKENEENSVFAEFEALPENIYAKELFEGAASTVFEDAIIYDIICGDNNIAVVLDSDGNSETIGTELYINGSVMHYSDCLISGLSYLNGNFYFYENGNIMKISTDGTEVVIFMPNASASARVINETTVISEVTDGFNSELYVSYLKDSDLTDDESPEVEITDLVVEKKWTVPVQLTDFGGRIRSWKSSADINPDGSISIAAAVADIYAENESISQTVRLMYKGTEPISDIILTDSYAENIARGETATVNIGVINNTKEEVDAFDVKISAGETVLYEGAAELTTLYTGEAGYAQAFVDIPEDFEKQEVTVEIISSLDDNTENNISTDIWGYCELAAKLNGRHIEDDGYAVLTVTNKGCETSENTVITLENDNGEQIYSTDAGKIAPGESVELEIEIPETYRTFADDKNRIVYTVRVSSESEEAEKWNNEASYLFENTVDRIVSLNKSEVILKSGESYTPTITILPADGNPKLYIVSADESVATVDETGKVTAVGEGVTTVSYSTKDSVISSQLTVIVRNSLGNIKIAEEYKEYNTLYLTVDTTGALMPGETADLIVAIYNTDDALYSVEKYKSVKYSKQIEVEVDSLGDKKLKMFLWKSTENMKPVAKPFTYYKKEISGDYEYYIKDGYAYITKYLGINYSSSLYLPSSLGGADVIAVEDGAFSETDVGGCVVIIPSGIEKIGNMAFYNTDIIAVDIPETVKEIGENAFGGCLMLAGFSVSNDNNYYSTDAKALFNKEKTTLIQFATNLGDYAYTVPDGVNKIGESAFENCELNEITIPKSVTEIGENAFLNTNIKINYCGNVEEWNRIEKTNSGIPDNGVSFDASSDGEDEFISRFEYVSNGNGLVITGFNNAGFNSETLTIPAEINGEPVCEISDNAFAYSVLEGIKTVIISEGIEVIGNYAFEDNATVEWFVIPSTTWAINAGAFNVGSNLKGFTVAEGNRFFSVEDNVLFDKNKTAVVCYPASKTDTYYAVPKSVTSIRVGAFNNAKIQEIHLPSMLKTIDDQGLGLMWSLEKITVDDENTEFCSVDGALFNKDKTTLIQFPIAKGTSYTIPESVVSIGRYAFQLSRLESIYIGTEVKNIDFAAFNCWNMKNIYYKGTEEDWAKIVVGNSNNALTSATIHYNSKF